jgi:uncharacterized membrane protein YccF (DUF307 family)
MNKFYLVVGIFWMLLAPLWFHSAYIWSSIGHTGITVASAACGLFNFGLGVAYVWLARRKEEGDEDQTQGDETAEDQGHQPSDT